MLPGEWVGWCNIVLDKIPVHARIPVVQEGKAEPKQAVREAYQRLRPLEGEILRLAALAQDDYPRGTVNFR